MKIYIATYGEYDDYTLAGVFASWSAAYRCVKDECHAIIEVYQTEQGEDKLDMLTSEWITRLRKTTIDEYIKTQEHYVFESNPEMNENVDPTEAQP